MTKPVSLNELSVHARLIRLADATVNAKFDGTAGIVAGVVAVATLDTLDVPALSVADTGNTYRGSLNGSVSLAVTLVGLELNYHL